MGKKGVKQHEWSEEEIDFLREVYPKHGRTGTTKLFNERYGLDMSESSIKQQVQKHKIRAATNGCFPKGNIPYNKGVPMSPEQYAKCRPTMFLKGNIPANHKPIGSDRVTKDGYIEVKIAEPNKWELLQVLVMQGMIGRRLKKGVELVRFLDGNTLNCHPDNLILTTRRVNARINQRKVKPITAEAMKAVVKVEEIKCLIREKERRNED